MVQNQRLRSNLQQALTGQAELRREQESLRQQIAQLEGNSKDRAHQKQESEVAKLEAPVGSEITLSLVPGIARSVLRLQNVLELPPISSLVRLQLMLDRDEYLNYHAILRTAEGEDNQVDLRKLKSQLVGNKQRAVLLVLSSDSLETGDYVVTLAGSNGARGAEEEVEAYTFRAVRK